MSDELRKFEAHCRTARFAACDAMKTLARDYDRQIQRKGRSHTARLVDDHAAQLALESVYVLVAADALGALAVSRGAPKDLGAYIELALRHLLGRGHNGEAKGEGA